MTEKSLNSKLLYRIIFRNRWWQHILFWIAAFILLASLFSSSSDIQKIDLVYTGIFLVPLLTLSYLNLYLNIPLLLRREHYVLYLAASALLVWLDALVLYHLFDSWIDHILPGYYFIAYLGPGSLLIYTFATWMITTLLKLSRSWFMVLRMEQEKSTTELRSLRSQVNPHFLLNSLHTIYGLSLDRAPETPQAILQLSDILKYTLYETEKEEVRLADELQILEDYIALHRMRFDSSRVAVNMKVEGEAGELTVAPMLFLPFVENSFKHGVQATEKAVRVDISFSISKKELAFTISNTCPAAENAVPVLGGIGIENTRKRLDLLYPGRHKLELGMDGDLFRVTLNLKLH